MASEADKRELVAKMTAYIGRRYGGTGPEAWARAFRDADGDQDGRITGAELKDLLGEAGIGNAFTRGAWTDGVMAELDADGTGTITLAELLRMLAAPPAPTPPRPSPQPQPQPRPSPTPPRPSPPPPPPDDLAPANYVRIPGIGMVHVAVFLVGGGLLTYLVWRSIK